MVNLPWVEAHGGACARFVLVCAPLCAEMLAIPYEDEVVKNLLVRTK